MRECPDTDALVTIAETLNWDVEAGLHHLLTCESCRTQLEALQITRAAFVETEVVAEAALTQVTAALRAEARSERTRAQRTERWSSAVEAVLAGVTAVIVLVSSGIEIGSITAGLLCFGLGAAFLLSGRRLRLTAS